MLQKRYRCAKIDKSTQTSGDSEDAKEDQTTQKDKSSQTADADDRKGEDTKTADECFEITDKDILCVEIAGLCHDLGKFIIHTGNLQEYLHNNMLAHGTVTN